MQTTTLDKQKTHTEKRTEIDRKQKTTDVDTQTTLNIIRQKIDT